MSSVQWLKPDAKYERNSVQSLQHWRVMAVYIPGLIWIILCKYFIWFSHIYPRPITSTGFHDLTSLTWNPSTTNISSCKVIPKKKVLWSQKFGTYHILYLRYSQCMSVSWNLCKVLEWGAVEFIWFNIFQTYSLPYLPWEACWYPRELVYTIELSGKWTRPTWWYRLGFISDTRTWSVESQHID